MRKNIDLPPATVKHLEKMAKAERMKVKPFIEKLLINFSSGLVIKQSKTNP